MGLYDEEKDLRARIGEIRCPTGAVHVVLDVVVVLERWSSATEREIESGKIGSVTGF